MLGIAIYIWFRFEWQFGVGALVTLFHDVSMTLGFFALTQLQVDLNVVAAILTIVGYSLNDTVVIYDRIRENLRKYRKMAIIPLLNLSLNETLSRTMVTSLSILLALAAAADPRPGSDLRPDRRDPARHLRRHLFVDLHLRADPGLAGGQARQLPSSRRRDAAREPQDSLTIRRSAASRSAVQARRLASTGRHAREVRHVEPVPYRAAARRCRVHPSRRRLRRQQGQGRHRLCRARRQHALRAGQEAARPAGL